MNGLGREMRISGYVPLTDYGFALPVYQMSTEGGSVGQAPYVAIPEVEGDRQAPIAGFDILNIENMGVRWLPAPEIEVDEGDPWQDVFLWDDQVVMGTSQSIYDTLAPWHDDLKRDAPLTYLELALGAGSDTTPEAAGTAFAFLKERLGESGGARSYRNIVVRPGVLLELHRHAHRLAPGKSLPDSVRDFAIEPSGADQFAVKLPSGSVSLLGGAHAFARVIEAIAEFGRSIGAKLLTVEAPDGAVAEAWQPTLAEPEPPIAPVRPVRASLQALSSHEIAIDVGTANTRIFVRGHGIVLNEPSVAAIERVRNRPPRFRTAGRDAIILARNEPDAIELIRPLRDGAIADFEVAERMIRHFFESIWGKRRFQRRPDVIICVPAGSTGIERRAMRDAVKSVGVNKVWLIEEPMAAAIGAEMPVDRPIGSMIVDIGSGKTEVAVISISGVAYRESVRVGGEKMDELIATYLRRRFGVWIDEFTAERVKCQWGRALPPVDADGHSSEGASILIKGWSPAGDPVDVTITQQGIAEALSEAVNSIIEGVRIALENTAPELAADIVDNGIVLTGGGALLEGMDEILRMETGLPVSVPDQPLECVALGLGEVLDHPELRSVLIPA